MAAQREIARPQTASRNFCESPAPETGAGNLGIGQMPPSREAIQELTWQLSLP